VCCIQVAEARPSVGCIQVVESPPFVGCIQVVDVRPFVGCIQVAEARPFGCIQVADRMEGIQLADGRPDCIQVAEGVDT